METSIEEDVARVFELAVDAMLIADGKGRILRTNAALKSLFGLEGEAPLELSQLIPEGYRAGHAAHVADYARAPSERPMETRQTLLARRNDGSEFAAEISLSPLPSGNVLATVHDVSARVGALADSHYWASHYQSLLAAIPDIVVEVDEAGRLSWGNAAARAFFGADLVGQTAMHFCRDLPQEDEAFATVLRGSAPGEPTEAWLTRTDGEARLLAWRCRPISDRQDQPGGALCSARDITERNRADEELRELRVQMEDLFHLHVARQTARKIAHDLNQPLNALSAYAEVAKRVLDAEPADPARLRQAVEGCVEEAQRAAFVMRKLARFMDHSEPHALAADLAQAVRNVVRICEADGLREVKFRIDIDQNLPPILANQLQIESILRSLIRNSVEAMRLAGIARPEILIRARDDHDGERVRVTLSDNGPGLDPETREQVFSPFFTTKRRAVGLGLTICRALIEAQGGDLYFEGNGSPGATFQFTWPVMS